MELVIVYGVLEYECVGYGNMGYEIENGTRASNLKTKVQGNDLLPLFGQPSLSILLTLNLNKFLVKSLTIGLTGLKLLKCPFCALVNLIGQFHQQVAVEGGTNLLYLGG